MQSFKPARWLSLPPWLLVFFLGLVMLLMWRNDEQRVRELWQEHHGHTVDHVGEHMIWLERELKMRENLIYLLKSFLETSQEPDFTEFDFSPLAGHWPGVEVASSTDVANFPEAVQNKLSVPARALCDLAVKQPWFAVENDVYLLTALQHSNANRCWLVFWPLASKLDALFTAEQLQWMVTGASDNVISFSSGVNPHLVTQLTTTYLEENNEAPFIQQQYNLGAELGGTETLQLIVFLSVGADLAGLEADRQKKMLLWLFVWALCSITVGLLWVRFRNVLNKLVREFRLSVSKERDALAETSHCLQLALENSQSGYWDWNILSQKINFSEHWKTMLTVSHKANAQAGMVEWVQRIHPEDLEPCKAKLRAHVQGLTSQFEHEHRIRDDKGRYVWFLTRGKVTERDSRNRALRMLGVYTRIDERKRVSEQVLRQQQALRQLNEITSLPGTSMQEILRQGLELGARYLNLPLAIVSQIEGDQYTVYVQSSPPGTLTDGQIFHLPDCFCAETLRLNDVMAIHHTADSDLATHPCYLSTHLEAYIGGPLWVEGKLFGTLNFSSPQQRSEPFSESEQDFVRLLSRWAGATLERWFKERENRELSEHFTKLANALPGCVCQFQLYADGSSAFPFASRGIEDVYGLCPAEVVGSAEQVMERIHPEDKNRVQERIALSAENLTPWSDCYRVLHPSKGEIWVRGETSPEKQADGSIIWHGYLWEVTEEVKAEQALSLSNRWRKAILNAASVSLIAVDCGGIIRTFNRGAEKMLGYSAEEAVGQLSITQLHRSDQLKDLAKLLGIEDAGFSVLIAKAREGIADEREWQYVRKNGSEITVVLTVTAVLDEQGAIEGYLGVARDVSVLKAQEEELRAGAERTQTILNNAADGIVVLSSQGQIDTFNKAAEKIFGWTADEVLGSSVSRLIFNNDERNSMLEWLSSHSSAQQRDKELLGMRKSGEQFPIEVALSEVTRAHKPLYIAMVRDITERKRIERMKSEFIAIVSHELRTPLTAISGALKILNSGALGAIPDTLSRLVDIAHANSDRLILLVNDLLDMEKLVAGKMAFSFVYQPLLPIIQKCIDDHATYASEHSVTLRLDDHWVRQRVGDRAVVVNVDAARLEQVMANLLSNATKFSPPDSEVKVVLEWEPGQITVNVIDKGPGIPEQFKPQIFQKFSQADSSSRRSKGGTGLGLAISKQIIENMEGRIDFQSTEGRGSRFFLVLPAYMGAQQFVPKGISKPKVLHVEDDQNMADLMLALAGESVDLNHVTTLQEAKAALKNNTYQLIILDLLLPDGDGWELLDKRISGEYTDVVVVSQMGISSTDRVRVTAVIDKDEHLADSLVIWLDRWLNRQQTSS
ncbi:PAS domain S-box protein [Gilvimarinus chinensis]|uniref:PAS domain S-box protein n=1 Tax=Gilvimarinus chinensis TaxID=396005 RepID=UPI00035C3600|nr:PAS domain S-box protein [Gilvimarinus chinensis]